LQSPEASRFTDDVGQASVLQRAVAAAGVVQDWGKLLRPKKRANLLNHRDGLSTQIGIDLDLVPPAFAVRVDGTARHGAAEHLFQAQRLSAKLQRRVFPPTFADLVLHRIWPVRSELDQVGLATYAQALGPQRHIALDSNVSADGFYARVHPFVSQGAANCVYVLVVRLLDAD